MGATEEAHCIFERGGVRLAIPVRAVWRVLRGAALTPVPGAPGWLAGVLVHAGEALAVASLDDRLGGLDPQRCQAASAVVIADAHGLRFGMAVDRLISVEPLAAFPDPLRRDESLLTVSGDGPLIIDVDALAGALIEDAARAFCAPPRAATPSHG